MNRIYHFALAIATLLLIHTQVYGQQPVLGSTADFAVFTAVGAFTNTGATVVTGDVGTNVGAFSGFPPGTVIGDIHVADGVSAQAATDVAIKLKPENWTESAPGLLNLL